MTEQSQDNVVILPPIIPLATIVLAVILDWLVPLGILARLPFGPRFVVGAILFAAGASLPVRTKLAFARAGTNIRPDQPTTAIVTTGPLAHVRNPAYQGGAIALIGLALMMGSDWMLLLMVPGLILLHYGVVLREERYLERKFGETYRGYKASVPRYGWKV
jgi:protein-S-isoprenylcysteine O-methyltransferase Ste14